MGNLQKSQSNLSAVFADGMRINPKVQQFLHDLVKANPGHFWNLFSDMRRACEAEAMIYQTARMLAKTGKPYNTLALSPDGGNGLQDNSGALANLEAEGYVVVNAERNKIALTDKMIAVLMQYSIKENGNTPSVSFVQGVKSELPVLLPPQN